MMDQGTSNSDKIHSLGNIKSDPGMNVNTQLIFNVLSSVFILKKVSHHSLCNFDYLRKVSDGGSELFLDITQKKCCVVCRESSKLDRHFGMSLKRSLVPRESLRGCILAPGATILLAIAAYSICEKRFATQLQRHGLRSVLFPLRLLSQL